MLLLITGTIRKQISIIVSITDFMIIGPPTKSALMTSKSSPLVKFTYSLE